MLFNEPKLLKFEAVWKQLPSERSCFSALQRAEIAEMQLVLSSNERYDISFSALQRAEIADVVVIRDQLQFGARRFSALQRAEIAEVSGTIASASS